MVEKKFISFEEALLHFMSEWDYEKNFISPKDISCKSKERIWFVCSEGHSFVSSPIMRLNGSKCKKCGANERALLKRKQTNLHFTNKQTNKPSLHKQTNKQTNERTNETSLHKQ